ncbi:rRNA maturation RNase YbeY [Candidatus Villigracilis affinis]|uniref:rRNA maturation RNase YbeY n=1 Tax=Candidatus Villigracilis affinis TaxID=3140682 RepID=UPI0031EFBE84
MLERAARFTLDLEPDSADADITIVLTDDAQLHELNREYLGVDAPTDVLSFPASETDPETGAQYLGDIVSSQFRAMLHAGWRTSPRSRGAIAGCAWHSHCWVTTMPRREEKAHVCGRRRPR